MILDSLLFEFGTSNVAEVAKAINETEREIDRLKKKEDELNEKIKEGGEEAEKAREELAKVTKELKEQQDKFSKLNNSWEGFLVNLKRNQAEIAKVLAQFAIVKKAVDITKDYAMNVLEVADAAKEAKQSIEEYQQKTLKMGKYASFTRQDVNNAKEYEQVIRDIRMGQAAIASNLAKVLLPVLTGIMKIVRNVIDFFVRHWPLVRIAVGMIAILFLPAIIKGLKEIGKLLWQFAGGNLKKLGLIAWLTTIALLLDDLYAWMKGGESQFGDFYNKLFGSPEKLMQTLEAIPGYLKLIMGVLATIAVFNPLKTLSLGANVAIAVLKALIPFIMAVAVQVWSITAALLANPITWIVAGVIILVAAVVKLWKNWDKVVEGIHKAIDGVKQFLHLDGKKNDKPQPDGSAKNGLDYVPFDGYIAELHKGERVQTADEANDWRSGLIAAKKAVNFTANYPLNAIPSGAVSNAYNSTSSNKTINIGDITIQTQATDGQGIAQDLASYIKQAVISLDDGMLA